MHRTRIAVAALLCLAGGALSLILLAKHYGVPLLGEAVLAACGEGGGCDIVSQSRYSVFLGLPLAAWGLLFYGSLLALLAPLVLGTTDENPDPAAGLGFFLVAAALGMDLVLLGLQIFVIDAFCTFCIATYGVNGLMLAALWPFKGVSLAINFLVTRETRRALLSWVVATLAVAATAVSGNAALADRKALAGSSILGIPTMIQAPVAKGSLEEQLAEARAEAKKWKDTLDDEKRLQVYLNQKARDDFNHAAVAELDLSRAPAQGSPKGPLLVVSYSDFMCPFCRDLASALRNYLPASGDQVRIFYKHFPLDMSCNAQVGRTVHHGACDLAKGGICASESGKFWEYHDQVFARTWETATATREDVLRVGDAVGLERARFNACLDSATTRGRLAKDIDEGWKIGVGSTPTILINGRRLPSVNVFFLALEEERKRLNLSAPAAAPAPQKK